ncbi:hypothetical protein F4692_000749 [Nocardioides cavernae]|uniref:FlgD/Vpr Ig-like domain-containing protein n=1 Tax=Nocardioides cavernae TaxID=1921566 RepID=A0A7Y9H0B7_9ACTN|nr:FlgD immunoglobulin-like domain containing protein [Nocardioides cavernae]NYE35645.1 hypothetical protein [Nocardioides cavernae]
MTRLRAMVGTTITAILGAVLALSVAPPASAAFPVLVTPAPGASLVGGSSGPLVLDFPTPGSYSIFVQCGSTYIWSNGGRVPYPAGRQTIPIDPLEGISGEDLGGATCQTDIYGSESPYKTTSTFTVIPPTLALSPVTATKDKIYPLVRDNYLDETEFKFSVNRKADATLTVTDPEGKTYYTKSIWADRAGEYRIAWKGQTTSGKPIKPGRYRATITAMADGATLSQSVRVQVATKNVIRRQTIRKDELGGRETTGGNCRVEYEDEGTLLDCWGGAYARSVFTFKIPADATNIRWRARTSYTGLDKNRGSITTNGNRTGKTTYQVRVQVTGWRAVYVHGASLTYKARVQI